MAKKKGSNVISVDFTGVEAGSSGKLLPEGPTKFEIEEVTPEEGESSGKPYLKIALAVVDGEDNAGVKAWDNMSLQPQALWKLRGFLDAVGIETVDGEMDIDPDELQGLIVVGDVVHEEYQGKTKHRISGYSAVEDEETEKPKSKKKKEEKEEATSSKKKVVKKAAEEEEEETEWKVKQKVTFKDGKKQMEGVITAIEDDEVTVRVGKDEYQMGLDDIEAA